MDELHLDPHPTAVRRGRRMVSERCRTWGLSDDATATAELLTSELLTNAVVHARSRIRLTIDMDQGYLEVTVTDHEITYPQPQPVDLRAIGGRGLAILEAVADGWGVRPRTDGKEVWFRLRVTIQPPSAPG